MQNKICILLIFIILILLFQRISAQGITDSLLVIKKIEIHGNKKTKRDIILRELTFKQGDTIHKENLGQAIDESKHNLLNTPLFNFVSFNTATSEDNSLIVSIEVDERWYTWPYIIFEHAEQNINKWIKNPDWSKLNYGGGVEKYNFRGRNEVIKLTILGGFTREFSVEYRNFYLDRKKRHSFSAQVHYIFQKQMTYLTENNNSVSYKSDDDVIFQKRGGQIRYTYRKKIHTRQTLTLEYENSKIADTINLLNPLFFSSDSKRFSAFTMTYQFRRDFRDIRSFPLKGYLIDFNISKTGIGLIKNFTMKNLAFNLNFSNFVPVFNRWYAGFGIKLRKSFPETQSYYMSQALGYNNNYIRGYEHYVIDGQDFYMMKNVINYQIIKKQVRTLDFIQ